MLFLSKSIKYLENDVSVRKKKTVPRQSFEHPFWYLEEQVKQTEELQTMQGEHKAFSKQSAQGTA